MTSSRSAPAIPDLLSAENLANPWPGYQILRDHYPVFWHEPSQSWVVSRYEHIKPLVKDPRLTHEYLQDILGVFLGDAPVMVAMEGRQHASRRKLVGPFLNGKGLDAVAATIERQARMALEPIFHRERAAVAAGLRDRGRIDFVTEFSKVFPVSVMCDLMALPPEDHGKFEDWYNAFILCLGNIQGDPALYENGMRAKREFGEYMLPLIASRRAGDGDDLISVLCRSEPDGRGVPMTDEEIRTMAALMLLGGAENTDHQLAQLVHTLVEHPEQLRALQEDRSLVPAAIAEGLRFNGIVQFIQRLAVEDVAIDGVTIPKGAMVTLFFASGNRDPRRFANPDTFDMFRTDNDVAKAFGGNAEHLGFGGGPHVCLGMQTTKLELEIALNLLLDNTSDLRLADGYQPRWTGVLSRALSTLELTFRCR
ncbi:cytochrome P450 [Mycobacterium sp. CVI_P3]|uniref:Cytochrome P450 n=1 Tax=Mycobacterium pinniadriaticum TaxID=2994102 RepID=A0ABT3SA79_9MYCO|nr:cytochrome P450 [Mycobacterium pinniadriaticum]MCX2929947.1 cytochrome P450 [Mycobacterium pinniadriaticum]MCX2936404.1 cytochrome P450 [Mycobacterium pinniadriaticum]